MTTSRLAGVSGTLALSRGVGWLAMLIHTSGKFTPRKGPWPEMSSYKMTPSAQMSVRASTARADSICSGDM